MSVHTYRVESSVRHVWAVPVPCVGADVDRALAAAIFYLTEHGNQHPSADAIAVEIGDDEIRFVISRRYASNTSSAVPPPVDECPNLFLSNRTAQILTSTGWINVHPGAPLCDGTAYLTADHVVEGKP